MKQRHDALFGVPLTNIHLIDENGGNPNMQAAQIEAARSEKHLRKDLFLRSVSRLMHDSAFALHAFHANESSSEDLKRAGEEIQKRTLHGRYLMGCLVFKKELDEFRQDHNAEDDTALYEAFFEDMEEHSSLHLRAGNSVDLSYQHHLRQSPDRLKEILTKWRGRVETNPLALLIPTRHPLDRPHKPLEIEKRQDWDHLSSVMRKDLCKRVLEVNSFDRGVANDVYTWAYDPESHKDKGPYLQSIAEQITNNGPRKEYYSACKVLYDLLHILQRAGYTTPVSETFYRLVMENKLEPHQVKALQTIIDHQLATDSL